MPGTLEGGKLAAETNIARHGDDYYSRIGAIGGRNGNTGGFKDINLAKKAGAIGGKLSRRGPSTTAKQTTIDNRKYLKSPYCTYCTKRGHQAYVCDIRLDMIAKNKRITERHGVTRPW